MGSENLTLLGYTGGHKREEDHTENVTSIAIQEGGCGSVVRRALFVGDEHGHLGAVLAAGKHLLGLKVC